MEITKKKKNYKLSQLNESFQKANIAEMEMREVKIEDSKKSYEETFKDVFQEILANQTDNGEENLIKIDAIKEYITNNQDGLTNSNLEITATEFLQLVVQADTDKDGKVNEQEFIQLAIKIRLGKLFDNLSHGENKMKHKELRKELDSNPLEMYFTVDTQEIHYQDFGQTLSSDKHGMIHKEKFVNSIFDNVLLKAKLVKKAKELFYDICKDFNEDGQIGPISIDKIRSFVTSNPKDKADSELCITYAEVLKLAQEADINNDDKIDEEEFINFVTEGSVSKRRLGELFDSLCAGEGKICIVELKKKMKNLYSSINQEYSEDGSGLSKIDGLTQEDFEKILHDADLDDDGMIDKHEFKSSAFARILLKKKHENKILWKALQFVAYAEIYQFWPPPKFIPILTLMQIIFFYSLPESVVPEMKFR